LELAENAIRCLVRSTADSALTKLISSQRIVFRTVNRKRGEIRSARVRKTRLNGTRDVYGAKRSGKKQWERERERERAGGKKYCRRLRARDNNNIITTVPAVLEGVFFVEQYYYCYYGVRARRFRAGGSRPKAEENRRRDDRILLVKLIARTYFISDPEYITRGVSLRAAYNTIIWYAKTRRPAREPKVVTRTGSASRRGRRWIARDVRVIVCWWWLVIHQTTVPTRDILQWNETRVL